MAYTSRLKSGTPTAPLPQVPSSSPGLSSKLEALEPQKRILKMITVRRKKDGVYVKIKVENTDCPPPTGPIIFGWVPSSEPGRTSNAFSVVRYALDLFMSDLYLFRYVPQRCVDAFVVGADERVSVIVRKVPVCKCSRREYCKHAGGAAKSHLEETCQLLKIGDRIIHPDVFPESLGYNNGGPFDDKLWRRKCCSASRTERSLCTHLNRALRIESRRHDSTERGSTSAATVTPCQEWFRVTLFLAILQICAEAALCAGMERIACPGENFAPVVGAMAQTVVRE
ncbi:hypothetical protein Bbelb_259920 [Branchiostoma belcheri]|nr:hypothetical protein Bbelb_259920 [Branchiostoma belcheri]